MLTLRKILLSILRSVNRRLFSVNWRRLRNTKPVSEIFGIDRGQPIDRYYIEKFLKENKELIKGSVLEIGDDKYSKQFGAAITSQEILHFTPDNPQATIIGDLTKFDTLKPDVADCIICTQTLNFIYDFKSAISGIYYLLRKNGCALVTVSGISQISRYDMDRWGDYWRFTEKSVNLAFTEVFGRENVEVEYFGNVLTSVAFLEGISSEELREDELLYPDKDYQLILTIKAIKKNFEK